MAFLCQEKDCKLWAESECSCPDKFRLCGYHNLKHHETIECNTRSLKKELNEGFAKVKENEKVLDQIKGELISTADRMIAILLQMVYEGVNVIETKKIEINEWMRLNEDKNIEDILGSFKHLKIKERSLKKFMKSIKNTLSLQKLNNKELKAEICELKGQNGYLQAESEKTKMDFAEFAKKIREGNYSLRDYEKELKDLKSSKDDIEKELFEKNKNLEEIKRKIKIDEVVKAEQQALRAKLDKDQAEMLRIQKENEKTRKANQKELEKKEKIIMDEKQKVDDENKTLRTNLTEANRIANEEKEKYDNSVKEIEKLAEMNKKLIDEFKDASDKWNNEKNEINGEIKNLRQEMERIERE